MTDLSDDRHELAAAPGPLQMSQFNASARLIALSRGPGSHNACAFVKDVTEFCVMFDDNARRIGPGKTRTMRLDIGIVLGGLMRALREGYAAAAPKDYGSAFWLTAAINRDAFWARVAALRRAGLIVQQVGGRCLNDWGLDVGRTMELTCTAALISFAAKYDILSGSFESDWCISPAIQGNGGRPRITYQSGAVGPGLSSQQLQAENSFLWHLNAHFANTAIRGCRAPVFQRRFMGGDLRLGGRFYALGDDNCQSISASERAAITIGGESVVELTATAMGLSIALNLLGDATPTLLRTDLYSIADQFREATKIVIEETLRAGQVVERWPSNAPERFASMPIEVVVESVLRCYPTLANMSSIVPPDLRVNKSESLAGWAVAQYLVGLESRGLAIALDSLMAKGIACLAIIDGLLVPRSAVGEAAAILEAAFEQFLPVSPHFAINAH